MRAYSQPPPLPSIGAAEGDNKHMEPDGHYKSDAPSESVLDDLRLFRDKLLEYANLAGAIMQRKLNSDGHDRRMTLWQELSEEYGRLQWIVDEAVIGSEPGTWRGVLTPPFNRSSPSSILRRATMVSEAIGHLEQDIVAGRRDEKGMPTTSCTDVNVEVLPFSVNMTQSIDAHRLHQSIETSSRRLFVDGHYAQAIFEAFKTVNNCVKSKTGLQLDGEKLMAAVFNESRPLLLINQGDNKSDLDERKGFKFLYMGAMTGIRNPKAHENVRQEDPVRTLRYLTLASLLVEVAEQATLASGETKSEGDAA